MSEYTLHLTLKSDTTFGRGDGVTGLVDAEVEHDELGLPFLRGRALKGLLVEECANILYALEKQHLPDDKLKKWRAAAVKLFGQPGSSLTDDAQMQVGDAVLPQAVRDAVRDAVEKEELQPEEVLASLTTIRRQTAMEVNGAPKPESLRSIRVILRETFFTAELGFDFAPQGTNELILLGACAAVLRRVGLGRNRGRGRVEARLIHHTDITVECLQKFEAALSNKETT